MKFSTFAATAVLALGMATQAHALPITLTLSTAASPTYQQQDNSPCVIGDNSCHNPSGFGSTTLASSTSTYTNIGSPIYTVQNIRDIVGNIFKVGVDVNTTQSPLATEWLDSFSLAIAGTTQFLFNTSTQLATNNNGNGYSDALLSGFDLTSFAAAATAQFFVTYHNATDGREEFFLIPGNSPPIEHPVPEPITLSLLGLGLGALAMRARKRV